jgi:hypothetical protein
VLRYPDLASFRADWAAWLFQGLAFVPYLGIRPALEARALVRLQLDGQVDLCCPARVVMEHSTGFGVILDLDPHQLEGMAELAASSDSEIHPKGDFDAAHEATTSLGRAFWARLFGLQAHSSPLEQALDDLVDPLGSLELDRPARRALDALLSRSDEDYLVICERVAELLAQHPWSWPALEERVRGGPGSLQQASAYIVLAHTIRREAVATLRKVAVGSRIAPSLVEIVPEGAGACSHCLEHQRQPTDPLSLARRGLPPFHLGCTCRVARTIATPDPR